MKSKVLTFLLSFIPGVGHLYLGLLTRGLQFMLLFFGAIFVISLIELEELIILMPIIWFYSLFDALQKYDLLKEGVVEDVPLIRGGAIQSYNRVLAYCLIGIGGYLLLERLIGLISGYIGDSWRIMHEFQLIVVALIFLIIGFRLLRSTFPGPNSTPSSPESHQREEGRDGDE